MSAFINLIISNNGIYYGLTLLPLIFFVDELLGEINAGLVSLVLNINLYKMIPWFRAFDERVKEV